MRSEASEGSGFARCHFQQIRGSGSPKRRPTTRLPPISVFASTMRGCSEPTSPIKQAWSPNGCSRIFRRTGTAASRRNDRAERALIRLRRAMFRGGWAGSSGQRSENWTKIVSETKHASSSIPIRHYISVFHRGKNCQGVLSISHGETAAAAWALRISGRELATFMEKMLRARSPSLRPRPR